MTPRILTSARDGSWSPILEVSRVTSSYSANFLVKVA